jgi:hypothetical protein
MKEKQFTRIDNVFVSFSDTKKKMIVHFRDQETRKLLGRITYCPETNTMHFTKGFKALLKNNEKILQDFIEFGLYVFSALIPYSYDNIHTDRGIKVIRLITKLFWKEIRKDKTLTPYLVAQEL